MMRNDAVKRFCEEAEKSGAPSWPSSGSHVLFRTGSGSWRIYDHAIEGGISGDIVGYAVVPSLSSFALAHAIGGFSDFAMKVDEDLRGTYLVAFEKSVMASKKCESLFDDVTTGLRCAYDCRVNSMVRSPDRSYDSVPDLEVVGTIEDDTALAYIDRCIYEAGFSVWVSKMIVPERTGRMKGTEGIERSLYFNLVSAMIPDEERGRLLPSLAVAGDGTERAKRIATAATNMTPKNVRIGLGNFSENTIDAYREARYAMDVVNIWKRQSEGTPLRIAVAPNDLSDMNRLRELFLIYGEAIGISAPMRAYEEHGVGVSTLFDA